MSQLEFHKNELQLDYFNESYRQFESDLYKYSALDTPLTFPDWWHHDYNG